MKVLKIALSSFSLILFINSISLSTDKLVQISLDGGREWVQYKSIEEFSNDFVINTNIKGTNLILDKENRKYIYSSLKEAIDNVRIVYYSKENKSFVLTKNNVEAKTKPIFNVFPNPFINFINIKFNIGGKYQIVLNDAINRNLIDTEVITENNEIISIPVKVNEFGTYLYNILIFRDHNMIYSQKLIESCK